MKLKEVMEQLSLAKDYASKLVNSEGDMRIVSCRECNKSFSLCVPQKNWDAWIGGELIQNAMPFLSGGQRELLLTRTCGECWESLFKDEE